MAVMESLVGGGWSQLAGLVALIFVYPIAIWFYNVSFHPLAKFPGPLRWGASRLPYTRAIWKGRFPNAIQSLHERYGDVVRTAPNELSFRQPAAWDDIYSNTDGANPQAFPKSELWHGNPGGGPASVFVTPGLKEHSQLRRFLDPAFSERATLRQEPIIHQYVDLCIHKLRERCSAQGETTVNIIDWLNFVLLDIIGDLSFGESFGCTEKCEYEDWMENMDSVIKLHYLSINLRYFPLITTLLKSLQSFLIPKEIVRQQKDYRQRARAKLERRLASNIDRPDIVSLLLRSEDQKEGLTKEEVVMNSMLFINAASETTVTTMTGAFNYLVQNPASLSELEQEVRQYSLSSELTLETLKQMPYLNAVLNEALRMCGPTPVGNIRIAPPQGGMVAGHYVPGNTFVTIPGRPLAFSSKYFHEPYSWCPERWLQEAQTDPKSPFFLDQRKGIRAFGWGAYNCVGEPLAWAQMRVVLAKLVWTFDLKMASTKNQSIDWEKQKVWAVIFKDPLDVTFAERTA